MPMSSTTPDARRGEAALSTGEALVERTAGAGRMAPLHARDEAETYELLEGAVTFYVGDQVVAATPGAVVVAPPGVARTFRVESERARWLVRTRVASVARFEDFARAVATPAADGAGTDWPSPEEAAALAAIGAANGIELLAPPGRLP